MIIPLSLFALMYVFIVVDKVDKTIVSIIFAMLMLLLGHIPFEQAAQSIDLNVIFLLTGMMACVSILGETGFFEFTAMSVAQKAQGKPLTILCFLLCLTAIFSAFLDNVTTVLLLAPVTILICQILEISPAPFLILEAISSNIGGTTTLIGDPPNIVIGSQANLSFWEFIKNLLPVTLVIFLVFLLTIYCVFRNTWRINNNIRLRIENSIPILAITDMAKLKKCALVFAVIFIGFLTHHITHLAPGIIALSGAMIMSVFCGSSVDKVLRKIEWDVIFFFVGLFIVVGGLEHSGVIHHLASNLLTLADNNLMLLCICLLIGSALFSAFLDNIPFVITMVPLIQKIITDIAQNQGLIEAELIRSQIAYPLWWSLALGACLGGNGSLIGASANILASKIGQKNKCPISFVQFSKYGFPIMVQSIVISIAFILWRFFL